MEDILKQIEACVRLDLLYPAFMTCLALIDICAYSDDKKAKQKDRYIKWFEHNMSEYAKNFSGEEIYALRCVILHNGEQIPEQYNNRLRNLSSAIVLDLFLLNSYGSNKGRVESAGATLNTPQCPAGITIPSLYNLGVPEFCLDVVESIRLWAKTNKFDLNDRGSVFLIAKDRISLGGVFLL